jgi:translation initiation factor IF-2
VIYSGKVSSLRRFKDDVKEVATSFECGVGIDNWQDIQVGDQFEVIEFVEVARKLSDSVNLADEKKAAAEKKAAEALTAKAQTAGKAEDDSDTTED